MRIVNLIFIYLFFIFLLINLLFIYFFIIIFFN